MYGTRSQAQLLDDNMMVGEQSAGHQQSSQEPWYEALPIVLQQSAPLPDKPPKHQELSARACEKAPARHVVGEMAGFEVVDLTQDDGDASSDVDDEDNDDQHRQPASREGEAHESGRSDGRTSRKRRQGPGAVAVQSSTSKAMGQDPKRRRKQRRTVTFQQVWNKTNSNEDPKVIVQDPKSNRKEYYIIQPCTREECDRKKDWGITPIGTASRHLQRAVHDVPDKSTSTVLREFGIQVLGCTEALMTKNNDRYEEVTESGSRPQTAPQQVSVTQTIEPPRHQLRNDTRAGPPDEVSAVPQLINREAPEDVERELPEQSISAPVLGHVYAIWCEDREPLRKGWSFVTPLPMPPQNFEEIGLFGDLLHSPLCSDDGMIPKCYTKLGACLEWAPGFEDGGARVDERLVPMLFLQPSLRIPPLREDFRLSENMGSYAWIEVKRLRPGSYRPGGERQPEQTLADCQPVASAFLQRLEASRRALISRDTEVSRLVSRACSSRHICF